MHIPRAVFADMSQERWRISLWDTEPIRPSLDDPMIVRQEAPEESLRGRPLMPGLVQRHRDGNRDRTGCFPPCRIVDKAQIAMLTMDTADFLPVDENPKRLIALRRFAARNEEVRQGFSATHVRDLGTRRVAQKKVVKLDRKRNALDVFIE